MAEFTATARIPCRPLSMDNKHLAEPKELLVDYRIGSVGICKEDGTIIDFTNTIKEIIKQDTSLIDSIMIEIDGIKYSLQTIVAQNTEDITNINQILNALGYYIDSSGDVHFTLIEKIATIDPDTGDVIYNISTSDITETPGREFVDADEKSKWNSATKPFNLKVTIKGGESNWTAAGSPPYVQNIYINPATENIDITENDCPIVDIYFGSADYSTIQKQLDSYAYIYKIITTSRNLHVYATNPTEVDLTIQLRFDRPSGVA